LDGPKKVFQFLLQQQQQQHGAGRFLMCLWTDTPPPIYCPPFSLSVHGTLVRLPVLARITPIHHYTAARQPSSSRPAHTHTSTVLYIWRTRPLVTYREPFFSLFL
jgi:hypothetical protein